MSTDTAVIENRLHEFTLPLHRDLGRIEGKLSAVEGRLTGIEQRVLRNEAATEEGFRLAEQRQERSSGAIEAKLDSIEAKVAAISLRQAANDGSSKGSRSALWTVGSISFAAATLIVETLNLVLRHG